MRRSILPRQPCQRPFAGLAWVTKLAEVKVNERVRTDRPGVVAVVGNHLVVVVGSLVVAGTRLVVVGGKDPVGTPVAAVGDSTPLGLRQEVHLNSNMSACKSCGNQVLPWGG